MTRLPAIGILIAATSVAVLAPKPAIADEDKSVAAQMFATGKDLFKRKDYDGARAAFTRAYAIDPQARYLWDLALSESLSDHPVEALGHFRQYIALPDASDDHRRKARTAITDLMAKTARVVVEVPDGSAVTADGQDVAPSADHELDLLPGKHTIEAHAGTRSGSVTIEAKAGETTRAEIQMQEPPPASRPTTDVTPAPAPAPIVVEQPVPPATTSWWTTRHTAGVVTAAGGVVALGLNVALYQASSNAADASTHNTFAYATWVTFGVGVAALATGAALMLWPDSSSRTVIAPAFMPSGGGVYVGRDF